MGMYREEHNHPPHPKPWERFIQVAANVIIGGAVALFVLGVIAVGRLVF